ncbi:MAG: rRNA pseudouridine synthase, partial [Paludibacteraceae bacterium]|nr:rRNA pseudouridine synthase [Paludibacteraceae bacterium]
NNNRGGYNNNRGGYNNNRGYNNNNYDDNRNNYDENNGDYNNNRGGYNNDRGGYNNNRGGYNNNRGGYNNNRGGYNNNRGGGYNNNRGGGYNNNNRGGGYNNNRGGGYNNNRRPNGGRPQMRPRMPQPVEYDIQYDPNEEVRLNKFLANAGVCSRREADQLIMAGAITVNGVAVSELGTKILRSDKVMINDQTVNPDRRVYLLLNKPKDCVTTTDDPNAKTTVMDIVKNACRERIYPVGRLDRNTTGVLLLTNDGDLAAKLTHPQYNKKKVYEVALDRALEPADYETILNGITLEDGEIKADNLSFVEEDNNKKVGIEIHSGRNRIVRRIFEHLGYRVMRLDRTYFAGLTKKNLRRGQWRFLSNDEVNKLRMGSFE